MGYDADVRYHPLALRFPSSKRKYPGSSSVILCAAASFDGGAASRPLLGAVLMYNAAEPMTEAQRSFLISKHGTVQAQVQAV